MGYEGLDKADLTLRDRLARDRTVLANERTLLAYARTTIMLLVSSISLFKIFPDNSFTRWVAVSLIPFAVMVASLGFRRYLRLSRSLAIVSE